MATQSYAASVQGIAVRITRLDEKGNLLTGPMDSYTTSAFIRTSFTPEYEDGDEITEKAADGTVCVSFKAPNTLKRINLEIAICEPDPELTALMSGGLLLEQGRNSVGWASAQVGEEPSPNGVAVEVWSRAVVNGKPAPDKPYFHWVFPYVKPRLSGDRVIENGLMATTFEGEGLGNINFRSAIDGRWLFPAASDRPYMYARSSYAPDGLKGFYTWTAGTPNGLGEEPSAPTSEEVNPDVVFGTTGGTGGVNPRGTNVPKNSTPYPYNDGMAEDPILSAADAYSGTAAPSGMTASATQVEYPSPAVQADSTNKVPTGSKQPQVTYLDRMDTSFTKDASVPGARFATDTAITASDSVNASKLTGLGYVPVPTSAWPAGSKIQIDKFSFHWDGTSWKPGAAPK